MGGYILQRLWQAGLVVMAVSMLSFVLIFLSGDSVAALVPLNARPADIDNIRRQYSLDQPLPVQYALFISRAIRGDMGESFPTGPTRWSWCWGGYRTRSCWRA